MNGPIPLRPDIDGARPAEGAPLALWSLLIPIRAVNGPSRTSARTMLI
jgi:hypothetical protein